MRWSSLISRSGFCLIFLCNFCCILVRVSYEQNKHVLYVLLPMPEVNIFLFMFFFLLLLLFFFFMFFFLLLLLFFFFGVSWTKTKSTSIITQKQRGHTLNSKWASWEKDLLSHSQPSLCRQTTSQEERCMTTQRTAVEQTEYYMALAGLIREIPRRHRGPYSLSGSQ